MSFASCICSAARKFYFSRFRNLLTGTQLLVLGLFSISVIVSFKGYLRYEFPALRHWFFIELVFIVTGIGVACFASSYLWSYKKTRMMLRADGRGRWSIHMGPVVSSIPCAYARTDDNFMMAGTNAILRAAQLHQLAGVVALESHLLGERRMRDALVRSLRRKLPGCTVHDMGANKELGCFNAYLLTLVRDKHREHRKQDRLLPFSGYDPVGTIEVHFRCPPAPKAEPH